MSNILAIAQKELRAYFASPIGYVVVGAFALMFGYFYASILYYFVRMSMEMGQFGMGGPQHANVNQQMIRPLLQNVSILILFTMPIITMRSYAEEKRSGTIELLLTSPLTDIQILLGKFLGVLTLYVVMLGVTMIHVGMLFFFGRPEWKEVVTAYVGLILMGGCFIAVGMFISSLTSNQIVAAAVTFFVFLFLWVANWFASFSGPVVSTVLNYLSIVEQWDDFGKGIIDTSHLVYYLCFITFGLFLTFKSMDSERWRG
jgi:ABC-2 type transport system permease protein